MKNINICDYNYILPQDRIATYPLQNRDSSKLLTYKNGEISHTNFEQIIEQIPTESLMVFNNTRVIRARLEFAKATGARIEIFCLEPHEPNDYSLALSKTSNCEWKCLIGNSKKWKGEILVKELKTEQYEIKLLARRTNLEGVIRFEWNNSKLSFSKILEHFGIVPIPPYLNRDSEEIDNSRYQTILSRFEGSVAAPTAGLHFSEKILEKLIHKNISFEELTLHVGAGTFRPVLTESISKHVMHKERVFINKINIESFLRFHENITAVGTTSVRTLESLYWIGVKLILNKEVDLKKICIEQWEVYDYPENISVSDSLTRLLTEMESQKITEITGETGIMIVPGYKFRMVNRLITNFHQPKSTLLLLIASFVGDDWKKIYQYATDNNFRFLSYGDSSFLVRQ